MTGSPGLRDDSGLRDVFRNPGLTERLSDSLVPGSDLWDYHRIAAHKKGNMDKDTE